MTKPTPHYYPFGSLIQNRSWSDASREYRFGFNTQEKDNEVAGNGNSYTAEFWQYDGRLGRRFNLDPKSNISISLYVCFANNPIVFTDTYGDTIDFSRLNVSDKATSNKILTEWSEQTGLNLSINSRGKIEYEKDAKGEPIIRKDANGKNIGSKTMRKIVLKSINRKKTIYYEKGSAGSHYSLRRVIDNSGKKHKEHYIQIDAKQIDLFQSSFINSKNKITFGYGMVAFHELVHFQKQTDDPASTDPSPGRTEYICNKVRIELGYELRTSYTGFIIDGMWYIPFSKEAYKILRKGKIPEGEPMIVLPAPPKELKSPIMVKP